ncbi:MAG: high-potential iron-sulfur protein, partial [Rhodoferax sp.]|nr:high-potential iron-sulfur protein [Rhodoferax sp.]
MISNRRVFLIHSASASAALAFAGQAQAQEMVDEKNPQAAALGYVADAKRVDTKKYPKYAAGQVCTNCSLFQGKP